MASNELLAIEVGFELIKAAKKHFSSHGKQSRRLNDDISTALRGLYFMPTGVLSLLRDIVGGKTMTSKHIQTVLTNFNDKEWEVRQSLNHLDFDRLSKKLGLTLASARALDRVRYGKLSLREEIQQEVNYYGQGNVKPNKKKIRKLISDIEKLNSEIEGIEQLINSQAFTR